MHAALKQHYRAPGDIVEAPLDGYCVDLLRGALAIEIQTGSFANIATKLRALVTRHRVLLVHPVALETWLVRAPPAGVGRARRRRTPQRAAPAQVFEELVSFPDLLGSPNFELEVAGVRVLEVQHFERRRTTRRGRWVTRERTLDALLHRFRVRTPDELWTLLPRALPEPFAVADLARALAVTPAAARRVAFCLRESGAAKTAGSRGRAPLYARGSSANVIASRTAQEV